MNYSGKFYFLLGIQDVPLSETEWEWFHWLLVWLVVKLNLSKIDLLSLFGIESEVVISAAWLTNIEWIGETFNSDLAYLLLKCLMLGIQKLLRYSSRLIKGVINLVASWNFAERWPLDELFEGFWCGEIAENTIRWHLKF